MRKSAALGLIACLCLSAGCLFGQSREELVASVMDVTGITRQYGDASNMISALYGQNRAAIDPKYYDRTLAIIGKHFSATAFTDYIKARMLDGYDEALLKRILEDYRDPLFVKITKREVEVHGDYVERAKAVFDYSLVGSGRDRIFEKYIEESKLLDMSEKLLLESLGAFFTTFNLLLPKERKLPDAKLEQVYGMAKAALRSEESRLDIKKRFAVTYEPFSDAELSGYFAFYTTPEGEWLTRQLMDGFSGAFQKCLSNAAQELLGMLEDA